ncbi:adenylate/guanylate cyclase domain-containing protein [Sulfitobacter sediminilitoris]|uniref:adenylate/guanylate cyclase domain-containing protein n=1 Tax=Sulfitobacter sediminilitoris TaxID=2698830 RepID=UPI00361F8EA1
MERRISAILAADMVGYSRLIELDETGTLERQKRHRLELIDPVFEQFNGKIIKLTGDGLIAEFGSVVEAVQCAVTTQKEMAAREADIPDDRKIQYRIAVNLGDVVFDDNDIYGDGVNIAARLESLAEPGGVVVSGPVHDLLKSQVEVGYKAMGEQQLKNIATPVRVYQVVDAGTELTPIKRVSNQRPWLAAAVLVGLVAAVGLVWSVTRPEFVPAEPDRFVFDIPDKPSIAVMPFEAQGSKDQTWLSEGIAQAVIFELVRSPEMLVISANAIDEMKGQTPAQIAERYGVRYVLRGSILEQSGVLRVGTQLVDAKTGRVIWADKFDRSTNDLIAVQDEISSKVQEEMEVKLTLGEQARSWRDFLGSAENMRDFVEGRVAFQQFDAEGHEKAKEAWTRIYERDPNVLGAKLLIAWLHWHRVLVGLSDDPAEDFRRAQTLVNQEIAAGGNGHAYVFRATLNLRMQQHELVHLDVEQALRLNPGDADVLMISGSSLFRSGRVEEGLKLMLQGMRREPDYPDWIPRDLAEAYVMAGQFEEATTISEEILASDTKDALAKPRALMLLAAISQSEGKSQEAKRHVEALQAAWPGISVELVTKAREYYQDQEFVDRLAEALREAGLPDVAPANPDLAAFAIPDKPSIAVAPFANVAGNPEAEWLSIGLSDSVISALTSSPDMIVISRHQLNDMVGRAPSKISETFGVRYVLDGKVQLQDRSLRISARLTDALEGRSLWAEKWDRDIDDIFAIQDEIAEAILEELQVKLTLGEQTRSWRSDVGTPENMRDMIRGRVAFQTFRPEDHQTVARLWRGIYDRNPELPAVINLQGWLEWHRVITGLSSDPRADLLSARKWAQKALDAGGFGHPHALYATASHALGDAQSAVEYAEMAIEADPGEADVLFVSGWIFSHRNRLVQGIELLQRGMRLEPDYPGWVATSLMSALVQNGSFDEARQIAEAILSEGAEELSQSL